MIGGLQKIRYFVTGFVSDNQSFEVDLPAKVSFQDVQDIIGVELCPTVHELTGCVYPLKKSDLPKIGIDISALPNANYFFESESDGFYSRG